MSAQDVEHRVGDGDAEHGGGPVQNRRGEDGLDRSEEHTSELQSRIRISYAVFCLKKNITSKVDRSAEEKVKVSFGKILVSHLRLSLETVMDEISFSLHMMKS